MMEGRTAAWDSRMAVRWISVADAEREANERLPSFLAEAIASGVGASRTRDMNVAAFSQLEFITRVASATAARRLSTPILGCSLAMPLLLAPAAVHGVHPEGELAAARAAARAGTAFGLSFFAGTSVEEIVDACPITLLQMYWSGGRDDIAYRVSRARAARASGLILTLDWSFADSRDSRIPSPPDRLGVRAGLQFAPRALARPLWLARWALAGSLPRLVAPNAATAATTAPTFASAYEAWRRTAPPTWDDLRWLRRQWDGPLMLKGILHPDDARHAIDIGADAICVSNHGGNNLDGAVAAIRALPIIADAVKGRADVLMDGGVRRGSDVIKALALGANAVMTGRPYLWGLVAGQPGVERVLEIFRGDIDAALLGLGRSSVDDVRESDVVLPEGFPLHPSSEETVSPPTLRSRNT